MIPYKDIVFDKQACTVSCQNEQALSVKNILTSVVIAKNIIDSECGNIKLKQIECYITPAVKQNLIIATKRLLMYGKSFPLVSRYDQWLNPLPSKLNLSVSKGVKIQILDPDIYGELYFGLHAVKF